MSILKIKGLRKSFGGIKALDNCSLDIPKGKITAVIGPNGSGKTTLFNAISNIIDIDSGKIILIDDKNNIEKEITNTEDHAISRGGVSRTFQNVRLFKNLTIKDHIEIAMLDDDVSLWKTFFKDTKISESKIKDIIKTVGLDKPLNTLGSDLSYGQRKLLDLAVAISNPHSVLMLDEPVAGVNPLLRRKIKSIILHLKQMGETVLLIEHDMDFVMDIADVIYVMDSGKIIASGKPEEIQRNKKVLEAYLGG